MLAMLTTWLWDEFRWPPWASTSCVVLLLALLLLHAADRAVSPRAKAADAASASPHKDKSNAQDAAAFKRFRWQYLTVYFLVMFADWLQGTHMYSLYQSYGVNVGALFLTGFLSSAVFGSFVGPIVDRCGRRHACLVYCALEILINLLENVPDMTVLLIGRVLGGISTSLLFSAFESWMVTEHRARGFAEELIPTTFAIASEGNGILAVLAGFVAQAAADAFGEIGPFRLAVAVTTLAGAFVCSWTENYGSTTRNGDESSEKISSSPSAEEEEANAQLDADAYALGLCYSLFDGAMFVFVFLWYPTLEAVVPDGILPSGLVFSSFMLCIAIGGKLFDQISRTALSGELLASLLCAVSVLVLLIPTATDSFMWILGAFFIFELAIGAFAPCCGTLRTRYFPTSGLSTTLGLFRLPTNVLVVVGTGGASRFTTDELFGGCSVVLLLSTLCAVKLYWSSLAAASSKKAKTN